ncbi:unnamed protein product [Symbiodinium pilosum]|uniref:Uncharacterized protein n=1 Tax=Symbiodinium pilosum TaxID=2952 RepID=A0A812NSE6_SYMPI|nr:unnamed protein product [Symbiodinium pilosum]
MADWKQQRPVLFQQHATLSKETKKPKYAVNPNKYLEDGEGGAEGEDEEEEDVPEDLADLEPEEQQKRIKPAPKPSNAS